MKAISVVSGGMDSVTLAYKLAGLGYDQVLLSFDYGQRHKKELDFARRTAADLGARHHVVDLSGLRDLLAGSALTSDIPVPHGHYAEDNMRQTVVPNRNAIMLSIAYGVAVSQRANAVATGVHAGDHFVYPDCRPAFVDLFGAMERVATEGFAHPDLVLLAPFVQIGKHDIVAEGVRLDVPYDHTWSCYEGGDIHCGRCGTCVERKEAFLLAGVTDPTEYADPDYAPEPA